MIRSLRPLAMAAALLALVAVQAQAQTDVTGTWEFTSEGRRGAQTTVFTFVQEGMTVTGTTQMMMGGRGGGGEAMTIEISDGKIEGNVLTFKIVRSMGGGGQTFEMTYTATVDGNAMSGTTSNQRGETPFTAVRKEG